MSKNRNTAITSAKGLNWLFTTVSIAKSRILSPDSIGTLKTSPKNKFQIQDTPTGHVLIRT